MKHLVINILATLILFCLISIPACTCESTVNITFDTPPAGYTRYIHDTVDWPFSFEYPETWKLKLDKQSKVWDYVYLYFGSSGGTQVIIASISRVEYPDENAHDIIQLEIEEKSDELEYHYLGGGKTNLGKAKGEWVEFSYIEDWYIGEIRVGPRHKTERHVAVNYRGRTFCLSQMVDTDLDSYDEFKPSFDHILETFKFLE